jgi:glycosyltransferase involved in cell wall biosynthesis
MACGRPVIASRVGGIPELIRDRLDGLLVEPSDVASLGAAMAYLIDSPSEATAMGMRAQQRAAHYFSPERHLDLLTGIYSRSATASPEHAAMVEALPERDP